MSATNNNNNLDNSDPFPVFTPRNAIQAQNLRSPATTAQISNSFIQQQQQQQQQSSPYSSRYNAAAAAVNLQLQQQMNQNQNVINLTRTPTSNQQQQSIGSSLRQSNDPQRQIIPMVQNLNLNQSNQHQQLSAVKMQHQQSQSSGVVSSNQLPSHRKLFSTIENQLNNNDMASLLNGANVGMMQSNMIEQEPQMRTQPADLSSIVHLKKIESYFIGDDLKNELLKKNMISQALPGHEMAKQLPIQLKEYHNLVPLDNQQINIEHKSRTFGYQTISYRATHIKTNTLYYLKRIIGVRYVAQRCLEIVETLKKIQNANILSLRDVFGTKEFNDNSIIFVYDYFPGLTTLQFRLYSNPNINLKGWSNPYNLDGAARPYSAGKTINNFKSLGLLPEQSVWEFVIQMTSFIRAVHSANLACRIINPLRILVDYKSRLRLSGIGIFDVVDPESISNIAHYQQEDLVEFGRLVLALACNSLIAIQKEHINTSVDIISKNYSTDLRNLILHFMTPQQQSSSSSSQSGGAGASNSRVKSINDSMPIIGARFYTSLDNSYTRGDIVENELSKELENGRLFRLVTKLNIVLERPEGDWSETGDRYMIKLFRDYVFHQITQNGQPWIDLAHIVQCLNKFDVGSSEKICLVSPDAQNVMIVSYAQLKKCFEKVFNELTSTMNS